MVTRILYSRGAIFGIYLLLVVCAVGNVVRHFLNPAFNIGADFAAFYVAGEFANEGRASEVYGPTALYDRGAQVAGGNYPIPFHYPPSFTWFLQVLPHLPYILATLLWGLIGIAVWWWIDRSLRPESKDSPPLIHVLSLTLALSVSQGQNGWLTAALLAGVGLHAQSQPFWAGALLGLLIYKPQFGLVAFAVLLASKNWRAITSAAAVAGAIILGSLLQFGLEPWIAFVENIPYAHSLAHGPVGTVHIANPRMVTITPMLAGWGVSAFLTMLAQITVSCGAIFCAVWIWLTNRNRYLQMATLGICTILATPFAFDYDLVVVSFSIFCLLQTGAKFSWREKIIIALPVGWPIFNMILLQFIPSALGALVLMAGLGVCLRARYRVSF